LHILLIFHRAAGKNLFSLIAMSLNLDEDYFEKIGALNKPAAFLRLLHYPGLPFILLFWTLKMGKAPSPQIHACVC